MINDSITIVNLTLQPATLGTCNLCARGGTELAAAVTISRDGGTVSTFDVCEYCARAVRRLETAASGLTRFVTGMPGPQVAVVETASLPPALTAVLIHEYPDPLQDSAGALFLPQVWGGERTDGTWTGWLEFREAGGDRILSTNRETTQPNRAALIYWATGLQSTYFEGAFNRARRPHVLRR